MNHARTLLTVSAVAVVALAAVGLYANREGSTRECTARNGQVLTTGPNGNWVVPGSGFRPSGDTRFAACTVDRGGLVGADNAVYWWFAAAATLVIAGSVVAGRRMWPS